MIIIIIANTVKDQSENALIMKISNTLFILKSCYNRNYAD